MDILKNKTFIAGVCVIVAVAIFVTILFIFGRNGEYEKADDNSNQSSSQLTSENSSSLPRQTSEISVSGDDDGGQLDIAYFASSAYELKNIFAVKSFSSVEEIPVNAVVQFSFCHIFYKNIAEMNSTKPVYRSVTKEQIENEIKNQFGTVRTNITKSDLYNSASGIFEMWEPNYNTAIYADAASQKIDDKTFVIEVKFYKTRVKNLVNDSCKITAKKTDSGYIISNLQSN